MRLSFHHENRISSCPVSLTQMRSIFASLVASEGGRQSLVPLHSQYPSLRIPLVAIIAPVVRKDYLGLAAFRLLALVLGN